MVIPVYLVDIQASMVVTKTYYLVVTHAGLYLIITLVHRVFRYVYPMTKYV